MTQSTENFEKGKKHMNSNRKRRRRKRRTKKLFGRILTIFILLILIFGIVFGIKHMPTNDAQNIAVGDMFSSDFIAKPELPLPEYEISITVSVVGDCTLGTDAFFNQATSLNAYYNSRGPEYFLKNVRSIFESDDLTIANLEGTFTDSTTRVDKTYAFKGP